MILSFCEMNFGAVRGSSETEVVLRGCPPGSARRRCVSWGWWQPGAAL